MRVAIVGAGIMGLATAWALTKRGHAVTVLEQGDAIPSALAASGDEHRMIRRAYGSADGYARTISEGFEAWDEMFTDLGRRHDAPRGVLGLSQHVGDRGEQFREGLDRTGFRYRLFEPMEAARRYPFLDPATIRYAYLSDEGGALLCRRIAADLVSWLERHGATLRTGAKVVGIEERGDGTAAVRLDGGEVVEAERVVATVGAWTPGLFPELAGTVTPYRQALVYVEPPDDLKAAWEVAPAIIDVGGPIDGYVIPPVDGTGLKFGVGTHKRRSDDPEAGREPEPGEGEHLRDLFAPPLARIAEYRVAKVVTCAYAFTADSCFLGTRIGPALVISACSGHGYKFGAAIGRRVADALLAGDVAGLSRWLRAEAA